VSTLEIGKLTFTFPKKWKASKYDDWSFYRNQFGKMRDGIKAVDVLACDDEGTAWLIEVKDYRANARTKASDLGDEIAQKVFDTLAALLPAAVNGNQQTERELARSLCAAKKLRVVLHLEQPKVRSPLHPRPIDPALIAQKLRQLLKPVDAHPMVLEMESERMNVVKWAVSETPPPAKS
jgi:hypothetical protein